MPHGMNDDLAFSRLVENQIGIRLPSMLGLHSPPAGKTAHSSPISYSLLRADGSRRWPAHVPFCSTGFGARCKDGSSRASSSRLGTVAVFSVRHTGDSWIP